MVHTLHFQQLSKPSSDQSFDIDAILQGRTNQPQQLTKFSDPIVPVKDFVSSKRNDSLSDWLNKDEAILRNRPIQPSVLFPQKVTANVVNKPVIDLNVDDFFSNMKSNREHGTKKMPLFMTKTSTRRFYTEKSRYKPG
mgnify:CR=1 FL=1